MIGKFGMKSGSLVVCTKFNLIVDTHPETVQDYYVEEPRLMAGFFCFSTINMNGRLWSSDQWRFFVWVKT
ncbi:hypothetical protein L4D77_26360 [Photobacterium frigidiphilum]|uniref:hypothetical protein n=1 Tax=Photobacterium frigidiphilum TaxID=264736 RepID=UPI003D1429F3